MNIKDFINEQLQQGVNIEDLLTDIADTANEIQEEEYLANKKYAAAEELLQKLLMYIETYYPDSKVNEEDWTPDLVMEIIEAILEINTYTNFLKPLFEKGIKF